MLVNSATFASMLGLSKAAISKAIKRGAILREKTGLIDTDHPVNLRFRTDHPETMARAGLEGPRDEAYRFLEVQADFGEGFRPVIRYTWDAADLERDTIVCPLPRAVRVSHDAAAPELVAVFDGPGGEALPSRCEFGNCGADTLMKCI